MISKYIALVAGRSGGHIIPALTYADEFRTAHNVSVLFFSTDYNLDQAIIEMYPWITKYIPLALVNFPGINLFRYPLFIFQFLKCFIISFHQLYICAPIKIVSMGGYISLPVVLAGWMLSIPVELFELNAVPGRAAFQIARFSSKINVCFEDAKKYFPKQKVHLVDYPIRFKSYEKVGKLQAVSALNLSPDKKTILVLGGSQGSRFINQLLKELAHNDSIGERFQIIHQTGPLDVEPLQLVYKNNGIVNHVFDYKHDLQLCYEAADIIIARAGAGTLFEIVFFEKPAIIIPLEIKTTDHQVDNAYAMSKMHPQLITGVRQNELIQEPSVLYKLIEDKTVIRN